MPRGTTRSRWKVYFDHNENHVPYAPYPASIVRVGGYTKNAFDTFWSTLTYDNYERGRSSVTVLFKDEKGRRYSMFFAEFMRLVPWIEKGEIHGEWAFTKNGDNTGIIRVGT